MYNWYLPKGAAWSLYPGRMKGQHCIKRSAPLGLVLPHSAGNTLKFQRDNKAPYVFQGGSDGIGEPGWLRLMCVQTTARRCPLTTLPAGNLFLFKIWVNSRRYTSLRASSNTVGPEHVFNFHALNFKCGPFWHILAVHDKDKKKKKRKGKEENVSQVKWTCFFTSGDVQNNVR